MLTEAEIQKYEDIVRQHSRIAIALAHVLQTVRELQAENARLREELKGVKHGE